MRLKLRALALTAAIAVGATISCAWADEGRETWKTKPQVVVISLDGAQPAVVERYLKVIPKILRKQHD